MLILYLLKPGDSEPRCLPRSRSPVITPFILGSLVIKLGAACWTFIDIANVSHLRLWGSAFRKNSKLRLVGNAKRVLQFGRLMALRLP